MELLHNFQHESPNGRHLCLVFPVMGPNASDMERRFRTNPMCSLGGVPVVDSQSMLDVHPGNVLFSLPNIDTHF